MSASPGAQTSLSARNAAKAGSHTDSILWEGVKETQAAHSIALRGIADRLDRIIEILTPPETSSLTLDEILAQLVAVITDQHAILRRLDLRTAEMADHMGLGVVKAHTSPRAPSGQPRNGEVDGGVGHDGGDDRA